MIDTISILMTLFVVLENVGMIDRFVNELVWKYLLIFRIVEDI
jgi:hypothetical protein